LNSSGVATVQAALSPAGNHSITATYNSDGNYATSTSPATTVNVTAVGTRTSTTTIVSSANPSLAGQAVTFTATVKDTGATPAQTPTGTVTFKDGSTVLGTATLSGSSGTATATFSTSALTAGSHTITATYNGSTTFAAGSPASLTQTVNAAGTRSSSTSLGA